LHFTADSQSNNFKMRVGRRVGNPEFATILKVIKALGLKLGAHRLAS
jgi:DNA-binding phage protein